MRRFTVLLMVAVLCLCSLRDRAPANEAPVPAIGISRFRLLNGPIRIKGLTDASGLAFNAETKSLFAVDNKQTMIAELEFDGEVKRFIHLEGFEDTEGITWIGGDRFAVVEERRRRLNIITIDADTEAVKYDTRKTMLIDATPAGNLGLEGVGYDSGRNRFFIVKEKAPRAIYEVEEWQELKGESGPRVKQPWDIERDNLNMTDLSGVYYDSGTGHLLLLSDESKCVVECTVRGEQIARLYLKKGNAGLNHTPAQPEGITMDGQGRLYICSEPNLLYIFGKETQK